MAQVLKRFPEGFNIKSRADLSDSETAWTGARELRKDIETAYAELKRQALRDCQTVDQWRREDTEPLQALETYFGSQIAYAKRKFEEDDEAARELARQEAEAEAEAEREDHATELDDAGEGEAAEVVRQAPLAVVTPAELDTPAGPDSPSTRWEHRAHIKDEGKLWEALVNGNLGVPSSLHWSPLPAAAITFNQAWFDKEANRLGLDFAGRYPGVELVEKPINVTRRRSA